MFKDRQDAGKKLAKTLRERYGDQDVVVLALPRGGVVIGKEVADALGAPLGVVVTRKLASPMDPEYAIGSLAETGDVIWEESEAARFDKVELESIVARETGEARRRVEVYRHGKPLPDLQGKTVLLIDDGLATGLTMKAAVAAVKSRNARKIVVAVPHGARDSLQGLEPLVDDVVALQKPVLYIAVGTLYADFPQVSDEEVVKILKTYE